MLPITAKLLTVFILSAFATTLWKYWTRSSWNCALAAAAAALLFAMASVTNVDFRAALNTTGQLRNSLDEYIEGATS